MKQSNHQVVATIDASAEAAWEVIGAVSGVDNWFAPITACRVEGNKRYCSTEEGEFSEDILQVDHQNKLLQYSIPVQHMLPVENIQGQMKVQEAEGGKASIEWTWDFEVEQEQEADAKEALSMMGNMGIKGIEAHIHATVL